MKAIAYIRVSTKEQGDSRNGIEAQEAAIKTFCKSNNLELVCITQDVASGGDGLDKRPGLEQAINLCKNNRAMLITSKLDRLSRSVEFTSTQLNLFIKQKVKFATVEHGINCESFMLHLMAAFAEKERKVIGERTKAGLAAAKARGVVLGGPNIREIAALGAAKRKEEARVFIEGLLPIIQPLRDKWYTQKQIVEHLNLHNIKTSLGNSWTCPGLSLALKRLN